MPILAAPRAHHVDVPARRPGAPGRQHALPVDIRRRRRAQAWTPEFLGIYLGWGIAAGLAHTAIEPASSVPVVGAPGALSGIPGAYLVVFPRVKARTLLLPGFFWRMARMPAKWFLPLWPVFQSLLPLFMGGLGPGSGGVAHMAHIGGFAMGFATGCLYRKLHGAPESACGARRGWRARPRRVRRARPRRRQPPKLGTRRRGPRRACLPPRTTFQAHVTRRCPPRAL